MEGIQNTLKQVGGMWQSFSPSQKGTYTMILLLLLAAPVIYSYKGSGSDYVPLLQGRVLEEHQLRDVEDALYSSGLTGWRRQGADIMVPKGRQEEFAKALAATSFSPEIYDIVSEGLSSVTFMSSPSEKRTILDQLLKKQKSLEIENYHDVQIAQVNWTPRPRRPSYRMQEVMTGSVSVRMKGNRELTPQEVDVFRTAVANGVLGLDRRNVDVIDMANNRTYRVDENDSNDLYFRTLHDHERSLRQKIEESLSYIRDVVVTVRVELEKQESMKSREVKYDPKAIVVEKFNKGRTESMQENKRRAEPGTNANNPLRVPETARASTQRDSQTDETEQKSIVSGQESFAVTQGLRLISSSVSVTIPESYYQEWLKQEGVERPASNATDEEKAAYRAKILAKETEIKPNVAAVVSKFITAPEGVEPATLVSVISAPSLDPVPDEGPGMMDQAGGLVKEYGRGAGLALFALAALFMLNRSLKGAPAAPEPDIASILTPPTPDEPEEPVHEPEPLPPSRREDVQFLVKDNPEMAASLLNKWISS